MTESEFEALADAAIAALERALEASPLDVDLQTKGSGVLEVEFADGAKIIVDRKSYLYLNGTELDYSDDLMHSGFNLRNPNVKRTCGCGASFGV